MLVIGLTGSLATGKSSVAAVFKKLGARVLNADHIVHDLIKPKKVCYHNIVREFGASILKGKTIDRKKLAGIVFEKPAELKKLEGIIHPRVRRVINKELNRYKRSNKRVVLEIPLLFESGLDKLADVTVVVVAARHRQLQRAQKFYGMSRAQALQRIKAQMSLDKKIQLADLTIDNNGTKKQTEKRVKLLWQRL